MTLWGKSPNLHDLRLRRGRWYSRRRYMAVCLAPTVVVTVAFALGFAFSGYPLLCYLAAGLHLSGCVGDWYYVWISCATVALSPARTSLACAAR
ncbi:MAG: DUF3267 domain-containing protein [Collinsella sp.]